MSIFKDSGWKSNGADEITFSAGEGYVAAASMGQMHFTDPLGARYKFNFMTAGAGLSASLLPAGFDITTTDMPSKGAVYANTKWRNTLSTSDFKGAFLIYQGNGITISGLGGSGSIVFFDIEKGLLAGFAGTMATLGIGAAIAPAAVIGSCSAVYVSTGVIAGVLGAGVSGAIGLIDSFEKLQSNIIGIWRVTTNSKSYRYAFYDNGSCSWYEDFNILNPDGTGRWKFEGDKLKINWDSGSKEEWETPITEDNQKGIWTTSKGSIYTIVAEKTDIFDMAK